MKQDLPSAAQVALAILTGVVVGVLVLLAQTYPQLIPLAAGVIAAIAAGLARYSALQTLRETLEKERLEWRLKLEASDPPTPNAKALMEQRVQNIGRKLGESD